MTRKPTKAIFDSDTSLFRSASAGEKPCYTYKNESGSVVAQFDSAKSGKNWIEEIEFMGIDSRFNYTGDTSILTRELDFTLGSVEDCYKTLDYEFANWLRMSGCKDWKAYISKATGAKNFRYDVATIHPYKHGRSGVRKPYYLEDVRRYARKNHPQVTLAKGKVEADDYLVMMAERLGEDGVAMFTDKDGNQISGAWILHVGNYDQPIFSPADSVGHLERNGKSVFGYGHLFLCWQLLKGDKSVDGIVGCKGYGDIKALDALEEYSDKHISHLKHAVQRVGSIYKDAYGESHKYPHALTGEPVTASWKEILRENLRLLWMLRYKGDKGDLIFQYIEEM